jgi:O-methyltransferase
MDDLTQEERGLSEKLLAGSASLEEALQLYNLMCTRGMPFPAAWEERVLRLGLMAHPDRLDMMARLRSVLILQGKTVPPELETAYVDTRQAAEPEQDHQRAAEEYHSRSGTADMDEPFLPIYDNCRKFTMTSVARMYALYKAVEYIEAADIRGDIVECGVWRGGSMMVAAMTLATIGSTARTLHLFDTYEGLPRPDENRDVDIWGNRAIDGWLPHSAGDEKSHWAEAALEEVKSNVLSTGYPVERLNFVKGMVERTIPDAAPKHIALLRLDTDWYASTKHELEHLFHRLSLHGVLIIDDYGHFKGARKAVDEFFQSRRIPILLDRIDYSGRVGIKVAD